MARRYEAFAVVLAVSALLLVLIVIVSVAMGADKRDRTACEDSGGRYQQIGRVRKSILPTFMVVYGCDKE